MTHTENVQAILSLHLADMTAARRATFGTLSGQSRKALCAYLAEFAHGECVVCREAFTTDDPAVLGHVIPASTFGPAQDRMGFVPGNLAAMHRSCNAAAGDYPFHQNLDKINTDGIPTEWIIKIKKNENKIDRREARSRYGLPF